MSSLPDYSNNPLNFPTGTESIYPQQSLTSQSGGFDPIIRTPFGNMLASQAARVANTNQVMSGFVAGTSMGGFRPITSADRIVMSAEGVPHAIVSNNLRSTNVRFPNELGGDMAIPSGTQTVVRNVGGQTQVYDPSYSPPPMYGPSMWRGQPQTPFGGNVARTDAPYIFHGETPVKTAPLQSAIQKLQDALPNNVHPKVSGTLEHISSSIPEGEIAPDNLFSIRANVDHKIGMLQAYHPKVDVSPLTDLRTTLDDTIAGGAPRYRGLMNITPMEAGTAQIPNTPYENPDFSTSPTYPPGSGVIESRGKFYTPPSQRPLARPSWDTPTDPSLTIDENGEIVRMMRDKSTGKLVPVPDSAYTSGGMKSR